MLDKDHQQTGDIYKKLAPIYDAVMKDVDYDDWSDYIDSLIQYHHPHGNRLLELACGTGTMALMLEQTNDYHIVATDGSADMIHVARDKGIRANSKITWLVQDMRRLTINDTFDVVYMVFDSLNYLHKPEEILTLLEGVQKHLKPRGVFFADFTTPAHSPKIEEMLNTEQTVDDRYSYRRISRFDPEKLIHTNHFLIQEYDPVSGALEDRSEELHTQRIWRFSEIRKIVSQSQLQMIAAYENFDFSYATDNSDRITLVLQHHG